MSEKTENLKLDLIGGDEVPSYAKFNSNMLKLDTLENEVNEKIVEINSIVEQAKSDLESELSSAENDLNEIKQDVEQTQSEVNTALTDALTKYNGPNLLIDTGAIIVGQSTAQFVLKKTVTLNESYLNNRSLRLQYADIDLKSVIDKWNNNHPSVQIPTYDVMVSVTRQDADIESDDDGEHVSIKTETFKYDDSTGVLTFQVIRRIDDIYATPKTSATLMIVITCVTK